VPPCSGCYPVGRGPSAVQSAIRLLDQPITSVGFGDIILETAGAGIENVNG
jgi:hypothetical protein